MPLSDDPFEWKVTKAGKVIVYRGGKQIMIVAAKKAEPLLSKLGRDSNEDQQILARVTGQYRIGNERLSDAGPKRRG